jgi:hypothetical protein
VDERDALIARMDLLGQILDHSALSQLLECLSSLADRALIGRLATDPEFLVIRQFPNIYAGETVARIEARLTELGVDYDGSKQLVWQLRQILVRGEGFGGRIAPIGDSVVRSVCSRLANSGVDMLRCKCCGYHFRPSDMSDPRRKIVAECGIQLSQSMRQERIADPVKTMNYTRLHIDHVIPRAAWGPTDASNLQVLCELCNYGKLIFQNGRESISTVLAAAYSLYQSSNYSPNRTIFYSCLALNGSRCSSCASTSDDSELTVQPMSEWYTPWTVRISCYDCLVVT